MELLLNRRGVFMKNTDYELLIGQAEALIQGVPHLVANLANSRRRQLGRILSP